MHCDQDEIIRAIIAHGIPADASSMPSSDSDDANNDSDESDMEVRMPGEATGQELEDMQAQEHHHHQNHQCAP